MIDSISLNITQDFSFLTFEEKEFPSRKITSILRGNKKKTTEKNEPEIGKLIKKNLKKKGNIGYKNYTVTMYGEADTRLIQS